jgi:hypothetical protein
MRSGKKVMAMKGGRSAPKKMMGGKKVPKVKKMKAGRSVCRGMGAATKGGNFEVV